MRLPLKYITLSLLHIGVFLVSIALINEAFADSRKSVTSLKEIRERGVVMQQWENSCAAASLATVLTYGFRDPVSEKTAAKEMLALTDPQTVRARGGFSMLDMKKFVEGRGYKGSAYKELSFDELRIFHAAIVPIDNHGYNHYVVFNGVRNDKVLLADPAYGNRQVSIGRFNKMWMNGMAFVVTREGSE
jgi:predicted double-glycine peptidase